MNVLSCVDFLDPRAPIVFGYHLIKKVEQGYRLIFFYKVIHHLVAIPYSNLLIPVDTRTRHTNPNSFRHIQTSKDCYKYSYFPRSITLWNQLPTTFTTADTVDGFKSMIPVSALIPIFTP